MKQTVNPFLQVDVTEGIHPERFVGIFSPLLVSDTMALFRPGNVVLMGIQGTGKTALLNLLKPEVQLAYFRTQDESNSYPVPVEARKFISGGINLIRSGAIEFGQRAIEENEQQDLERMPLYFGDFLNYWIARDFIRSYEMLSGFERHSEFLGFSMATDIDRLNGFAKKISGNKCWNGYLTGCDTLEALVSKLEGRISDYRNFLNFNTEELPQLIKQTKTSIGEPISAVAEAMISEGLIDQDVSFFVRVDQYEELSRLEDWSGAKGLFENYRAVVNKMIGARDPRVSYRIGTRRHAWEDSPRMYGTSAVIEELRNYRIIDIDDILRRKEHIPSIFPKFAEDVFRRRLRDSGFGAQCKSDTLSTVFGASAKPIDLAIIYSANKPPHERYFSDLPLVLGRKLTALASRNPLSAKLGEGWIRQRLKRRDPIDTDDNWETPPWTLLKARWWRKERIPQALMQIAAANRQKMIWSGKQDIISLSGGNILVFVTICQFVWAAWLRSAEENIPEGRLPKISDPYVQDEGINQASAYWFRKLREDPSGDSRQRFISELANFLRDGLIRDVDMSYPGENGFTLTKKELDEHQDIKKFLFDASAFGALYDRRHTPKQRKRGESMKWYLNPILSPYFQIFVSHTKEPKYVNVKQIRDLLVSSKVKLVTGAPESQLRLF